MPPVSFACVGCSKNCLLLTCTKLLQVGALKDWSESNTKEIVQNLFMKKTSLRGTRDVQAPFHFPSQRLFHNSNAIG